MILDCIRINEINNGVISGSSLEIQVGQITSLLGPSGSGLYEFLEPVLVRHSEKIYGEFRTTNLRQRSKRPQNIDAKVEGLPPVINFLECEERPSGKVGDYLQLFRQLADIFLQKGVLLCPRCSGECRSYSVVEAQNYLEESFFGERMIVLAPLRKDFKEREDFRQQLKIQGFVRIMVSGEIIRLDEDRPIDHLQPIEVVVDRLRISEENRSRVSEDFYTARAISGGITKALLDNEKVLYLNEHLSCIDCDHVFLEEDHKKLLQYYKLRQVLWPETLKWDVGESFKFLSDFGSGSGQFLKSNLEDLDLFSIPINQELKTLSMSEWQRLRLTLSLDIGLTGLVYLFRGIVSCVEGNLRTIISSSLKKLAGQGNTVLLIDASQEALAISNQILECRNGVFCKIPSLVWEDPEKLVERAVGSPFKIFGNGPWGDIDFDLYNASIVGISGRCGVGKSLFIKELTKVVFSGKKNQRYQLVCQRPFRMTVVKAKISGVRILDFLGISDSIANLFALSKRGQERGYSKEFYRLDKIGGRCPRCEGFGFLRLDDGYERYDTTICSSCKGKGFKGEILEMTYNGIDIADALNMTIQKALKHFKREKLIEESLGKCSKFGLNEIRLNEWVENLGPSTSRALQLAFPSKTGKMGKRHFFFVDDPTCGSHPEDVSLLIAHLSILAKQGATIFVTIDDEGLREICDNIIEIRTSGFNRNAVLI